MLDRLTWTDRHDSPHHQRTRLIIKPKQGEGKFKNTVDKLDKTTTWKPSQNEHQQLKATAVEARSSRWGSRAEPVPKTTPSGSYPPPEHRRQEEQLRRRRGGERARREGEAAAVRCLWERRCGGTRWGRGCGRGRWASGDRKKGRWGRDRGRAPGGSWS